LTVVADEKTGHRLVSAPVALQANQFTPIKVEYFQNKEEGFISLLWRFESQNSSSNEVVPAASLYHMQSRTPISGSSKIITGQFTSLKPTNVKQGDSSTFKKDKITLHWKAPIDTGCVPVASYIIEAKINGVFTVVGGPFISLVGIADLSS